MKMICALLVFLSIGKSHAQLISRAICGSYSNIQKTSSVLTCNNKDTVFRYINGVNNTFIMAQEGASRLVGLSPENLLHSSKDNPSSVLNRNIIYNFSFVPSDGLILGLYEDIVEAMAQKLITDFNIPTNEAWQISFNVLVDGPKNLTEQLIARMIPAALPLIGFIEYFYLSDEFEDFKRILIETNTLDTAIVKNVILATLTNRQKMIVVSHSQGGLFVNQAWKELSSQGNPDFNKGKRWFTNLQIATPTNSNLSDKGGFLTNDDDFAALVANRSNMTGTESIVPDTNPDDIDSWLHHNLDTTYLNTNYPGYRDCVANSIIDAAEQLESNCESKLCKDLSTGVEHETKPHINPDGSPGGRVSVDAYVTPTAIVRSEAVVCGRAKVLDYASVYDNARIEGKAIVSKSAGILGNAVVSDTAYVTDGAIVSDNSLVLGNAVVAGNTFIYGNSAILDEAIVEGSISSVALSTGVTSIKDTIIGGTAYVRNVFSLSESSDISYITDNSIVFDSYISDGATLADQAFVTGNADIFGQVTILDNSTFSGGRIFGINNEQPIIMDSAIVADRALVGGEVILANESLIFQNVSISQRALLLDSSSMSGNSNLGSEAVILEQGQVSDGASVAEWAVIRNMASVIGNTQFFGKSLAADNAIFAGSAQALDNIRISGHAIVDQNARIAANVQISGRARIFGSTYVIDNVLISDDAQVSGNSFLRENARIGGNARVEDYAQISGLAVVAGNAAIKDYATVFGSAVVAGNVTIKDYSAAFGTANLVSLEPVIIEGGFAVCSPEQSLSMSVDESYNFCSAYF